MSGLWLRAGHRRFFFAEYVLELFTFVINPDQSTDNAASHKPLGCAEAAISFTTFCSRAGSGAVVAAFPLLFVSMIEASATAFFCCSRASFVLSATNLPAFTRLGFFSHFVVVVAVGFVACCVASTCVVTAGAVWVSPLDCSVEILKQMRMLSKNNNAQKLLRIFSAIPQQLSRIAAEFLPMLLLPFSPNAS